ncbi:MAG TPA: MFS transporter [Tepidisphaeraceae bacterium]|jgi:MFS family permease
MDSDVKRTGLDDRNNSAATLPSESNSSAAFGISPRGAELRRSLRLITVSWMFGSIYFATTGTGAPITLFAQGLGASKFQFGLLSAMPFLASLLSLPSSVLMARTGQRKWIFFWTHIAHRIIWLPVALVPVWIMQIGGGGPSSTAVRSFLILVFLNYAGQAIGAPAWFSWMADIVPDELRGRYFARRRSWGIVTAIPAAIITGVLLDRLRQSGASSDVLRSLRWCGYIFMFAAWMGLTDISLFAPVPDVRAVPHKRSLLHIFSRPLRDRHFLFFAGYVGTLAFAANLIGQFLTLYLIEKLKVTNTSVQLMLLVAPSLAQLLMLSVWGHAVDRMGKKPVLALASLGLVPVAFGWCLMSSGAIWLGYILTSAGAALQAGVDMANSNMILEMGGTSDTEGTAGTSYVAVNAFIINVAGCFGGLFAGLLAQSLQHWSYDTGILGLGSIGFYEVLFILSALLRLLALVVFLPKLHEPTAKPTHVTFRFVTANVYANLYYALALPLRGIRRRDEGKGRRDEDQKRAPG